MHGDKAASVYSVLVDKSKDISIKEQLSVALRYVDDEAVVQEHFWHLQKQEHVQQKA